MIRTFEKRLQTLEKTIQEVGDYAIWFDMDDRQVIESVPDRKIRQEWNFPTVYISCLYVENTVNDSGLVGGNGSLSDICTLFSESPDTGDLGKKVAYLMKGEKISVEFIIRKTSEPYNLRIAAIAGVIRSRFNNGLFAEICRKELEWEEKHSRLFAALFETYKFASPSGDERTQLENFGELFVTASGLTGVIRNHLNAMAIPVLN